MLRLDPSHPPVWRSPTVLQFGADPVAVLEDPQPWQLRVLRELERGIPDGAFVPFAQALGAPSADAAARLLARLRRALAADHPQQRRLTLQAVHDLPDAHTEAVAMGLVAAGYDVHTLHPFDRLGTLDPGSVGLVLVAHRVMPPGTVASLMAEDVPHVPIVLTGSGAEIGPVVAPGVTACLSCVAAHRRDDDPAWPAIAAQLIGRPVDADGAITWEAGIVAGRLIEERARNPSQPRNRSVTLRAGSLHRNVRVHRPHAECRCRSLAESGRAIGRVRLETTSTTAFARPA